MGKTAIVEGLAHDIQHGKYPDLANTKIFVLNREALSREESLTGKVVQIFSSKNRAKTVVYNRIMDIFNSVIKINTRGDQRAILFIDELHLLLQNDLIKSGLENLKEQLDRNLCIIGATSSSKLAGQLQAIQDMERRMEVLPVEAFTVEQTIEAFQEQMSQEESPFLSEEGVGALIQLSELVTANGVFPSKGAVFLEKFQAYTQLKKLDISSPLDQEHVLAFYEDMFRMERSKMEQHLQGQSAELVFSNTFAEQFLRTPDNPSEESPSLFAQHFVSEFSKPAGLKGPVLIQGNAKNGAKEALSHAFGAESCILSLENLLDACLRHKNTPRLLEEALKSLPNQNITTLLIEDADLLLDRLLEEVPEEESSAPSSGGGVSELSQAVSEFVQQAIPSSYQASVNSAISSGLRVVNSRGSSSSRPGRKNRSSKGWAQGRLLDVLLQYLPFFRVLMTTSNASRGTQAREDGWSVIETPRVRPSEMWKALVEEFPALHRDVITLAVLLFSRGLENEETVWEDCHNLCKNLSDKAQISLGEIIGATDKISAETIIAKKGALDAVLMRMSLTSIEEEWSKSLKELFPSLFQAVHNLNDGDILTIQEKDVSKRAFFSQVLRIWNSEDGRHRALDTTLLDSQFPELQDQNPLLDLVSQIPLATKRILITSERELERRARQIAFLREEGWRIVCFTEPPAPALAQENVFSSLVGLMGEGALQQLARQFTGMLPNASPAPSRHALLDDATHFADSAFTREEQFAAWFQLQLPEGQDLFQKEFYQMSLALWRRASDPLSLKNISEVLQKSFKANTKDTAIKEMTKNCAGFSSTPVSEEELRYAADPTSFSYVYRIQKIAKDTLFHVQSQVISAIYSLFDWRKIAVITSLTYTVRLFWNLFASRR